MCPFNDERVALRSALYGADGSGVVAALVSQTWGDVLQLAGDGLVLALAQGVEGAPDLARRCGAELRDRGCEGHDDLARQLDALLGDRPAPQLQALPVDLDELAGNRVCSTGGCGRDLSLRGRCAIHCSQRRQTGTFGGQDS
jgi:hypothetical protein